MYSRETTTPPQAITLLKGRYNIVNRTQCLCLSVWTQPPASTTEDVLPKVILWESALRKNLSCNSTSYLKLDLWLLNTCCTVHHTVSCVNLSAGTLNGCFCLFAMLLRNGLTLSSLCVVVLSVILYTTFVSQSFGTRWHWTLWGPRPGGRLSTLTRRTRGGCRPTPTSQTPCVWNIPSSFR